MRRAILLLALALAGCVGGPRSPFVRITADDGRVYYADMDRALHSEGGGFLAFRDLVTREDVRLRNGTYTAQMCPRDEVKVRQLEYLEDPSRKPVASDYGPPR